MEVVLPPHLAGGRTKLKHNANYNYDRSDRMVEYAKAIPRAVSLGAKGDAGALDDAMYLIRCLETEGSSIVERGRHRGTRSYDEVNFARAHELSKRLRSSAWECIQNGGGTKAVEIYKESLLFDAPYDFDSFLLYCEFDRDERKQFYLPRRPQLKVVVNALQRLADDELELLSVSMPPGVGKTATAIFFLCWMAGKYPDLQILGGSHSNSFLRGVYDECLRIMDPDGEYLWYKVFPDVRIIDTNAKDMRIDLGRRKRFETLEFSSVGSGNAGKVRATNLLYCDDLVESIEQAMSAERLEKLWQAYTVDLRQRKQGDSVKELHIATRWSVHDVIGRLEDLYEDNEKAQFIRLPAVDKDDHSNFFYPYGLGFSDEMYHQQRDIMDDASWKALYMNEPIERFGLLYDPSELRRYFDLPERDPDAILAVCDIADGGGDYWCMPVAYQYGNDFYIDHIVCDNGKPDIVEEKIVQVLIDRKVDMARFESNRAGGRVAESVQKKVKERGGKTKITTKWNQANKETRLVVSSGQVKNMFLFKDESMYDRNKEYRTAMNFLTGYTMTGKNKHDDVPDAMAQLVDFVQGLEVRHAVVMQRPF